MKWPVHVYYHIEITITDYFKWEAGEKLDDKTALLPPLLCDLSKHLPSDFMDSTASLRRY